MRTTNPGPRPYGAAALLALVGILVPLLVPARAAAAPETLLDFCVANPSLCAISVMSIDEGWERHLNPDRPQVLASTMKTVILIAYAQAVVDGFLSPDETMSRDEWARYVTLDGGALNNAWVELGKPQRVSWSDLARAMIRHSDNATPDHLLAKLGDKRVRKALKVARGFHDVPLPISAMFGMWFNGDGVAGTGRRVATAYGGMGSAGYRDEVAALFTALSKADGLATYRRSLCVAPPWKGDACDPPGQNASDAELGVLFRNHFTRSTTRTYAQLMKDILGGSRLPATVEAVM